MNTLFLFLISLIYLSSLVSSSSCSSEELLQNPISNSFTPKSFIKDQKTTGMCWDFAAVSYIENMYYFLTKNLYTLSTEQISDNIYGFYMNENYPDDVFQFCKKYIENKPRPAFTGGLSECALFYVSKKGIMTEYNYPFTSGGEKEGIYNYSLTTPIGVDDVGYISINTSDSVKTGELLFKLFNVGVWIISIYSDPLTTSPVIDDFIIGKDSDHAVLAIGLYECINNHETYLGIQNSWGNGSPTYNGYQYIRITNGSGNFVNNLNVFDRFCGANVFDKYAKVSH